MKFTPLHDDELYPKKELLPDGTYSFTIKHAEEIVSKTGKPMMRLSLLIIYKDKPYYVTDYLIDTVAYKLKHFCKATGNDYDQGDLQDYRCLGRKGDVFISTKKGTQKEDGTYYPDQNCVKDYIFLKQFVDDHLGADVPF